MRIQLWHLAVLLLMAVPFVLIYLAVRLGVRHGRRDSGAGRGAGEQDARHDQATQD
ncbi:hypothetical protein [uncultured Ornithinimicrobium sp.]|uniref:hypothetical protein n=1 Tax=uncultured Ornithinimicrobium sp. TaxID=259307 RepID=UPI0025937ECD|nr:hypothetical protein [uncultured Ornithinimicrobium sp.]